MDILKHYAKKAGHPPATPIYVGEPKVDKATIHIITYNESRVEEKNIEHIGEALKLIDKVSVTWIDICGLHNIDLIEEVGKKFSIHPLVLEDIVHVSQRPKIEEFDDYIFLVLRMFYFKDQNIVEEQVSLILGDHYVITFQERPGDIFGPIRERIRSKKFKISKSKSDYLAYSLVDAIVDQYFVILEELGDRIEFLEDDILIHPSEDTLQEVHDLKKRMLALRRSVWPLREVINTLDRSESLLFEKTTKIYIRDLYDHTIQVIDAIENYRDILSGILDIYLSSLSNRMNEIMKTLTIIATIFIPITFIAGVYGMNFKYMPELKWHFGYFMAWGIMIAIGVIMIVYFRKKKWL